MSEPSEEKSKEIKIQPPKKKAAKKKTSKSKSKFGFLAPISDLARKFKLDSLKEKRKGQKVDKNTEANKDDLGPSEDEAMGFDDPSAKKKGIFGLLLTPIYFLVDLLGKLVPAPIRPHLFKIIIGIVILVLALFVKNTFFGKGSKADVSLKEMVASQPPTEEVAIAVKGFKIGRFNFEDSLNVLGTIKGSLEFKLSFEVPGVISSINYREGERYEEGALLMSLRQDDILLRLKRAQAAARKSQTDVQIAQDKVDEHDTLLAMGAIPKTTLEKVKKELEGFKYEYEAARLEMKAHEAMLEKSNLYAPSAGMIGELNIEEGEAITANTLLGSHVNTEYVYAEFGIVERDVKKIALGQKARVFVDAYSDRTFEGVIENVAPVVAGSSRTATAKVRLENPERLLLPGMFCRIRVLLYSKKNTLVVPTDAIQGSEGDQFVYVVDAENNVATKRAITVGYTRPDYSQIDAGISEGEVIAVSGLERLEDGKKVRLLETQEAEA